MKTKSVLFSEMRNQLGKQVVGTGWKGRMVLRAYKIPANPKTLAQTAHRNHHLKCVIQWQAEMQSDAAAKAAWNTDALPRAISGYNLFMKLARSSRIDCDPTASSPADIDGSYTVTKDLGFQGVYVEQPDTTFEVVVGIGDLTSGAEVPFVFTPTQNGLHIFWVVDGRSKTIPPTAGDKMALHNDYSVIEETGATPRAQCITDGY